MREKGIKCKGNEKERVGKGEGEGTERERRG